MAEVTEMPTGLPSTNALDNLPIQQPLIDGAYVRFAGTSAGVLEDPPALDEERTYIVKARCKQFNRSIRADAEERVTTVMQIESLYEQGKTPTATQDQPGLYDEDEADDSEGTGD